MGKYWIGKKRTPAGIKHELEKFQSSAKQKAERASRNSARRSALRKGLVHKGDNQDVHHPHGVMDNSRTVVMSASKNRGIHEKSRLKGSKRGSRKRKR